MNRNIVALGNYKFDLCYFSLVFMFVMTIAFHDNTIFLICSQLMFIAFQFTNISTKKIHLSNLTKKYFCWALTFAAYSLGSYIWAVNNETVFSCFLSIMQVILLGAALTNYCNSLEHYKIILKVFVFSGIILCIRLLLSVPIFAWGSERVGNYIDYGNVTVTYSLSYIAVLAFFEGYKMKNKMYLLASIIMLLFSILSGSKKSIFIFVISIAVIMLFSSNNIVKKVKNTLLGTLILMISIYCVYNISILYNAVGYRIDNMIAQLGGDISVSDKSTLDRMLLMQYAKEIFFEHPILGVGLDSFRYINPVGRYAHNNYMEMLVCLGVIGTVLYYIFPIIILKKLIYKITLQNKKIYVGLLATLLCLLFMDIASVSYSSEPIQLTLAIIYSGTHIMNIKEGDKNEH